MPFPLDLTAAMADALLALDRIHDSAAEAARATEGNAAAHRALSMLFEQLEEARAALRLET